MQKLKKIYLLLFSALHFIFVSVFVFVFAMPRQELVFSRQTRRGGSQASRLLSVAPHTLRQAQRHAQQAASSASKQQAQVLVYKQPAPPPLESAATSEIPPILLWLWTLQASCAVQCSFCCFRNMLSKLESTEQSLVCVKQFSQKFIVSGTVHSETAQWDSVNHGTHGVVSDNHAYFVNSEEAEVKVTKSGRGWRISFSMSALSGLFHQLR